MITFPHNIWDATSLDSSVSLSQGGSERERGQKKRGSRGVKKANPESTGRSASFGDSSPPNRVLSVTASLKTHLTSPVS